MLLDNMYSLYDVNIEKIAGTKDIIIWGMGDIGHKLYCDLVRTGKANCVGFFDSNTKGRTKCFDVDVLTRKQLQMMDKNIPIVIAVLSQTFFQEIALELYDMGFKWVFTPWRLLHVPRRFNMKEVKEIFRNNAGDIQYIYDMLADDKSREVYRKILEYRSTNDVLLLRDLAEKKYAQYFPVGEIYEPDEKEIFIDGGCFWAETIEDLKKWTNDKYKKVYAFEPSKQDAVIAREMIEFKNYRAELVEAGLYNKKGKLAFDTKTYGASKVVEEGISTIDVISIDEFMENKNEKITLIKMDVEGSELAALEGAKNTIEKYKPKLAISLYHNFEDMWAIPLWINNNFPNYKLYVRHHSSLNTETILYAAI